jgi:CIC family chloride channel protein
MFIRVLNFFENFFDSLQMPQAFKPAIGALLLGVLAFAYPHLSGMVSVYPEDSRLGMPLIENIPHIYGSGFRFLDEVLKGRASFWLLFVLIFLKPLATSFTLGSGNSGGVFAPSLFTGAMLGGAFGYVAKALFPELGIEIGAYALVGMAAVFAAAAHAPLTSMLIVFEMSNDYRLILPLMAAGMVSSSIAQWRQPDSIYSIKLTKKGIRFDQGRDLDVMQGVQVEEVMNRSPITVNKDQTLSDLFVAFQETHLKGFPVMSEEGDLYGVVSMQDMERMLQDVERTLKRKDVNLRDLRVWDVATPDPITVFPDEPIWNAINKMAPRDLARLPVMSRANKNKLVGIISRSDILRAYDVALMRKQRDQRVQDRMALRKITGVEIIEATVKPAGAAVEKKLATMQLPRSTNIVSVERDGIVLIPDGSTVFHAGDKLTILCKSNKTRSVRMLIEGKRR